MCVCATLILSCVCVDFLFATSRRPEVMYYLIGHFEAQTGEALKYKYGERMFVADREHHHRDVQVTASDLVDVSRPFLFHPDPLKT